MQYSIDAKGYQADAAVTDPEYPYHHPQRCKKHPHSRSQCFESYAGKIVCKSQLLKI